MSGGSSAGPGDKWSSDPGSLKFTSNYPVAPEETALGSIHAGIDAEHGCLYQRLANYLEDGRVEEAWEAVDSSLNTRPLEPVEASI